MQSSQGSPGSRGRRFMWFIVLWVGGVMVVAAVAYAIRLVIGV